MQGLQPPSPSHFLTQQRSQNQRSEALLAAMEGRVRSSSYQQRNPQQRAHRTAHHPHRRDRHHQQNHPHQSEDSSHQHSTSTTSYPTSSSYSSHQPQAQYGKQDAAGSSQGSSHYSQAALDPASQADSPWTIYQDTNSGHYYWQ